MRGGGGGGAEKKKKPKKKREQHCYLAEENKSFKIICIYIRIWKKIMNLQLLEPYTQPQTEEKQELRAMPSS